MASPAHPRSHATTLRKLGGSLTVTAPGAEPRGRELELQEIEALLGPTAIRQPADETDADHVERTCTDGGKEFQELSPRAPTQVAALLQHVQAAGTVQEAEGADDRSPAVERLRPFQFEPFGDEPGRSRLESVANVELPLSVELGRGEIAARQPHPGAIIVLEQAPEEPVDLLVNGRRIARGEILVLENKFCVRITELTAPRVGEMGRREEGQPEPGEATPDGLP